MNPLNQFDSVAGAYDQLVRVVFGDTLLNAQVYFLDRIPPRSRVLVLGGGTGEIVRQILKRQSDCSICYIEASEKMLSLSRERLKDFPAIEFIHGTEADAHGTFDVIVTNFYLDLFSESSLRRIITMIGKLQQKESQWFITDFVNTGKLRHRMLLVVMYSFFRVVSRIEAYKLQPWSRLLQQQGFKESHVQFFQDGFIKSAIFKR